MERSNTGDELGDVSRDIGKRMLSVEQPDVHSNSKVFNMNLGPKRNNRTKQTLRLIAVALFFQLVLNYWAAPRAKTKWQEFRMLRDHSTDSSAASNNGQPLVRLGNNFNWTEVSIGRLIEPLFTPVTRSVTNSTYQQSIRTGQTAIRYLACNFSAPD